MKKRILLLCSNVIAAQHNVSIGGWVNYQLATECGATNVVIGNAWRTT